jgi:hypothetical protein
MPGVLLSSSTLIFGMSAEGKPMAGVKCRGGKLEVPLLLGGGDGGGNDGSAGTSCGGGWMEDLYVPCT